MIFIWYIVAFLDFLLEKVKHFFQMNEEKTNIINIKKHGNIKKRKDIYIWITYLFQKDEDDYLSNNNDLICVFYFNDYLYIIIFIDKI